MRDSNTYWVEDLHNGGKLKQRTLPVPSDELMQLSLPRRFYSNGRFRLHHPTEPAVELYNGFQVWYCHGKIHREDAPAIWLPKAMDPNSKIKPFLAFQDNNPEIQNMPFFVFQDSCFWAWQGHCFKVSLRDQIPGVSIEKQMPMEWLECAALHGLSEERQMLLKLRYHVVKSSLPLAWI